MERPLHLARQTSPDPIDNAIDLQRERERNDLTLKGAFENIIKKYSKDFTEVGDEIDLETGEIVVDNGHLSRMRDERDTGASNVGRFLNSMRSFLDDSEEDDEAEEGLLHRFATYDDNDDDDNEDEDEDEEKEEEEEEEKREDEDTVDEVTPDTKDSDQGLAKVDGIHRSPQNWAEDADCAGTSAVDEYDDDDEDGEDILASSPARPISKRSHSQTLYRPTPADKYRRSAQPRVKADVPRHPKKRRTKLRHEDPSVTHAELEAFGQSIATQIARFMGHFKGSSRPTEDDLWSFPALPQDTRTARGLPRVERSINTGYQPSPGKQSIWALPEETTPPPRIRKQPNERISANGDSTIRPAVSKFLPKKGAFVRHRGHASASDTASARTLDSQTQIRSMSVSNSLQVPPNEDIGLHSLTGESQSCKPALSTTSQISHAACGLKQKRIETINLLDVTSSSEGESVPAKSSIEFFSSNGHGFDKDYAANTSRLLSNNATGIVAGHDASRTGFTLGFEETLVNLVEEQRLPWDRVAAHFPGKSVRTLQDRYQAIAPKKFMPLVPKTATISHEAKVPNQCAPNASRNEGQTVTAGQAQPVLITNSRNMKSGKPQRSFTKKEDRLLVDLHERAKMSFKELAQHFRGRSVLVLRERYATIRPSSLPLGKEANSSLFSGFTPDEDDLIKELFNDHEHPSFDELEIYFPGRPSSSIADRYQALLDPQGFPLKAQDGQNPSNHPFPADITECPKISDGTDSPEMADRHMFLNTSAGEDVSTGIDNLLLINLREAQGLPWPEIQKHFPTKKKNQLCYIYYRKLGRGRSGDQGSYGTALRLECPEIIDESLDSTLSEDYLPALTLGNYPNANQSSSLAHTMDESPSEKSTSHRIVPLSSNKSLSENEAFSNHADSGKQEELMPVDRANVRMILKRPLAASDGQEDVSEAYGGKEKPIYIDYNKPRKRHRSKFLGENLDGKRLLELKEVQQLPWKDVLGHFPEENHIRLRSFYYNRLAPQIKILGHYDPDTFPFEAVLPPQASDHEEAGSIPQSTTVSQRELAKDGASDPTQRRRPSKSQPKQPRAPIISNADRVSQNDSSVNNDGSIRPHNSKRFGENIMKEHVIEGTSKSDRGGDHKVPIENESVALNPQLRGLQNPSITKPSTRKSVDPEKSLDHLHRIGHKDKPLLAYSQQARKGITRKSLPITIDNCSSSAMKPPQNCKLGINMSTSSAKSIDRSVPHEDRLTVFRKAELPTRMLQPKPASSNLTIAPLPHPLVAESGLVTAAVDHLNGRALIREVGRVHENHKHSFSSIRPPQLTPAFGNFLHQEFLVAQNSSLPPFDHVSNPILQHTGLSQPLVVPPVTDAIRSGRNVSQTFTRLRGTRAPNPLQNVKMVGVRRSRTVRLSRYDQPSLLVVFCYDRSSLQVMHSPPLSCDYEEDFTEEEDETVLDIDFKALGDAVRRIKRYPRVIELPRSGMTIRSLFPPDSPSSTEDENTGPALDLTLHNKENIAEVNGGPGADPKFRMLVPKLSNVKLPSITTTQTPLPASETKKRLLKPSAIEGIGDSSIQGNSHTASVLAFPAEDSSCGMAVQDVPNLNSSRIFSATQHSTAPIQHSSIPRSVNTWLCVGDTDSEDDTIQ